MISMRTNWMLAAVLPVALSVGCTGVVQDPPSDGGQIGEENGAHCEVVDRAPLQRDEVSPLGFSAGEILDLAVGVHEHELIWARGGSTALALTVDDEGVYEYLTQEVVVTGDGGRTTANIEPWCPNLVSAKVTLGLETADGAFAESRELELQAYEAGRSQQYLDLDEVSGTFDPWDHVPAASDYDEVRAWLNVTFEASGARGTIDGQGSGVIGDPNQPDSVAYAEAFDIARFGAAEE